MTQEQLRMQMLAGIITEDQYKTKLNEVVEVPTWLKGKLEDVHVKPGQGSIFSKPIDAVLKLAQDALDKESNIDKIANSTGTLTVKSPGIGYNLVLPIEQAKKLPGAKESEVEKIEGPNKIKVPAITTTAPLTQFKSDELTVIVRPKKDEAGAIIPNEYIVLSAFPGDPNIPRASEWEGKYAVIIPGGNKIEEIVNESLRRYRRMLNEELTISNDNYELPDFEEKKKQLNTLFPDGSIDRSNWKMFGSDSEEDFENSIEYGEIDSQRILGVIEAEIEDLFPGFEVSCIMYSGDEKANIMVKKGNDSLSFDLKVDVL